VYAIFVRVEVVISRGHVVFFIFLGLFVKPPPLNETPGPSGPYLFKNKIK
jgi:hypothetical protein